MQKVRNVLIDGRMSVEMEQPCVVRVSLPAHLRALARVDAEVSVPLDGPATLGGVLDAIEARYPVLRGAIREHVTGRRRPFVRFFACEQDLSHDPAETPLPRAVLTGDEPFLVVGAMAGG
jgi:sulfur-carrier protein